MHLLLALCLLGVRARAADAFSVAGSSPTFDDFIVDSKLKLGSGDLARAKDSAARAILLAPNNPVGYVQRGSCELKLKDWTAAEADATKAIELKYRKASPYNVRSAAKTGMGRYQEALADAETALQYSSSSVVGRMNLAAAQAGLKRAASQAPPARAAAVPKPAPVPKPTPAPKPTSVAAAIPGLGAAAKLAAPVAKKTAPKKTEPAPSAAEPLKAEPARWPSLRRDVRWGGLAAGVAALGGLLLFLRGRGDHQLRQVRYAGVPVAPPSSHALSSGAVVGRRYIVGSLVRSVDGVEYYDARDLSDFPRTIKRLASGPSAPALGVALARAQAAAGLKHPNVEVIEAFIQEGGHLSLACQPLPGETLERLRQKLPGRKVSLEQAVRLAQGPCDALEAAHKAGLVHGRISPSGLWVERGVGRLADFGLPPRVVSPYAAPEKEAGVEADLFALAACLYEAVSGTLPSEGPAPAGLEAVFSRALAADPRNRFHAASELLSAFKAVVAG